MTNAMGGWGQAEPERRAAGEAAAQVWGPSAAAGGRWCCVAAIGGHGNMRVHPRARSRGACHRHTALQHAEDRDCHGARAGGPGSPSTSPSCAVPRSREVVPPVLGVGARRGPWPWPPPRVWATPGSGSLAARRTPSSWPGREALLPGSPAPRPQQGRPSSGGWQHPRTRPRTARSEARAMKVASPGDAGCT